VEIFVGPNSSLEHMGVKIELIGQIEMYYDKGNNFEFTSLGEYFNIFFTRLLVIYHGLYLMNSAGIGCTGSNSRNLKI